jgi:hypothetical protein
LGCTRIIFQAVHELIAVSAEENSKDFAATQPKSTPEEQAEGDSVESWRNPGLRRVALLLVLLVSYTMIVWNFGEFDPALRGHLSLFDLGIIIKFVPGLTILYPSASLWHRNTPIQLCKICYSVGQFCAGRLMHWVCHGLKGDKMLSKKEKTTIEVKAGFWCKHVLS